MPPYTDRVLDILASECARATFFMIGRNARAHPDMVRKVYDAGHTIANHTLNHRALTHLGHAGAVDEIEGGISAIRAALGEQRTMAPFFRFPQLRRSSALEDYLAEHGIMAWSADFPADDWMRISANTIIARALDRIERHGKGVLLLHDVQPATVLALPTLLRELKERGYRIVHVVAGGADVPKPTPYPNPLIANVPSATSGGSAGIIAATAPWTPTPYPLASRRNVAVSTSEGRSAPEVSAPASPGPTPYPGSRSAEAALPKLNPAITVTEVIASGMSRAPFH